MACACEQFLVKSMSAKGPDAWALYRAAGAVFPLPPQRMWTTDDIQEALRLLDEFQGQWNSSSPLACKAPQVWFDELLCRICREHYVSWGLVTYEPSGRKILVVSHRGWHPGADIVVVDFRAGKGFFDHSRHGSVYSSWGVLRNMPLGVSKNVQVTLASQPYRLRAVDAYLLAVKLFNLGK